MSQVGKFGHVAAKQETIMESQPRSGSFLLCVVTYRGQGIVRRGGCKKPGVTLYTHRIHTVYTVDNTGT